MYYILRRRGVMEISMPRAAEKSELCSVLYIDRPQGSEVAALVIQRPMRYAYGKKYTERKGFMQTAAVIQFAFPDALYDGGGPQLYVQTLKIQSTGQTATHAASS